MGVEGHEKRERLMSIDALRGADMLFIMGFSPVVIALCALCGFPDCELGRQMTHVAWHGLRHHDTIFPLFLFLAGASWPFSLAGQRAKGRTTGEILLKIARRVLLLFFFGLATKQFFAFDVSQFRYDSVLAHIGFCWAIAAILFMFVKSWRARFLIAAALLVGHWALLFFCRAPDAAALLVSADPAVMKKVAAYAATGTDNFSFVGCLSGWIDRVVMPGHLHEGIFDPDGLLAKVTGVVTAMFGVFAGEMLRSEGRSGGRKTLGLVLAGLACLALTFLWRPWCPVNKKLWTSTFVLAVGAYSYLALAIFYWIVDVKGIRRWTFFFRVIGMNSITIYLLMRVVGFAVIAKFFFSGLAGLGSADWSRFVLASGQVAVEWLVLLFLYRKGVFLRV